MIPIVCAMISALAAVLVAIITTRNNRKINETHKQVTKNGGHNSPPTVLDKLHDIKEEIREVKERQIASDAKMDAHLMWHLTTKE